MHGLGECVYMCAGCLLGIILVLFHVTRAAYVLITGQCRVHTADCVVVGGWQFDDWYVDMMPSPVTWPADRSQGSVFVFVCMFVVLPSRSIYGHIRTGTVLWQCTLMVTLYCCLHWKIKLLAPWPDTPLITLTLSTNQSLPYVNNAWARSDKYNFLSHWFDSTNI